MDPSSLHSLYCQSKPHENDHNHDHDHLIDLGLSLRTLQPHQYHHHPQPPPPPHLVGMELMNWAAVAVAAESSDLYMKNNNNNNNNSSSNCRIMIQSSSSNGHGQAECSEEGDAEVVQSKLQQRWGYVKVNMDGVIVGRKVCIFQHGCYSSLALQLEDMFGRQCESGLKLFENESEFSLFYKDGNENWRSVGDVPWKQFVEGVKRLRIARKDEAFVVLHQN